MSRLLVDAPAGSAEIYLHGAHLCSWRPRGGEEVLFVSRLSDFAPGVPIRGGVPLCTPWFANALDGDRHPSHGWARTVLWELRSVEATADGGVRALFCVSSGAISALYEVGIGEELTLDLSVRNTGPQATAVEAALHTYLAVGDITAVSIDGLDGVGYWDKVTGATRVQDGALGFRGPTDRVYDLGASQAVSRPIVVTDPARGRRISVVGTQSPSAVVWNPWSLGARAADDMADDEWPTFVCVETARVREHAVTLAAGESMALGARFAVESL